jgi:hypothetical protein
MSDITHHLARAIQVRALSRDGDHDAVGHVLATLRGDVKLGVHDEVIDHGAAAVAYRDIMRLSRHDMPPPTDLVRTLIETVIIRDDILPSTASQVWQEIGINPNRGRGLMGRNAGALDWPIWFTLRELALSGAPPEDEE